MSKQVRLYRQDNIVSQRPPGDFRVPFEGREFRPITGYWKTGQVGMERLIRGGRIELRGKMLSYVRFFDDYPVARRSNYWGDTKFSSRSEEKIYVVQTSERGDRTLPSHGDRPRRPCARPDLRFRHHRLLSPSNGAAAGSRLTPRAWRWRWPVPASWALAIRFTCWPIPAKASSRKPKSPAPRRVRSPCMGISATASSMSACRTSRSNPSPTTRRSMSSGTSGRRSWSRCARS